MADSDVVVIGEWLGGHLYRRFLRLDDGGRRELPPAFVPPRPCDRATARAMAVREAAARGYGSVVYDGMELGA